MSITGTSLSNRFESLAHGPNDEFTTANIGDEIAGLPEPLAQQEIPHNLINNPQEVPQHPLLDRIMDLRQRSMEAVMRARQIEEQVRASEVNVSHFREENETLLARVRIREERNDKLAEEAASVPIFSTLFSGIKNVGCWFASGIINTFIFLARLCTCNKLNE